LLKKVNFVFVVDVLLKIMTPWPFTRRFVVRSFTVIFRDLDGISGFYWAGKFRPGVWQVAAILNFPDFYRNSVKINLTEKFPRTLKKQDFFDFQEVKN